MPLTAPFTGRRQGVAVATEAVRGTPETAADHWIPYASLSFREKVEKIRDTSGMNTLESVQGIDTVMKWAEGDIECNIRDKSIGPLLLSLFGTETLTADTPETGVYRHAFTVQQSNQHKSLTVWKKNPNESLAASNVMVTSMKLQAVLNQYVRATFGLIGKTFASETESFGYVEETKFRPQDATIKLATNTAGLSGATAIATIRSLTLNIQQAVEPYQGLGSVTPVDFTNGDFTVDGEFEIAYEASTYKDLVLNDTLRAMLISFANTGVTIGAASNPKLDIQLDSVNFVDFDMDESLENVVVLTAKFEGIYSRTNSSEITATLYNTQSTAY